MLSKSTNRAERTCPGCENSVIEASMVTGGIRRRQPAEERNVLRRHAHGTTLGAETQILDSNGVFLGFVAAGRGRVTGRPGAAVRARQPASRLAKRRCFGYTQLLSVASWSG